MTTWEDWTAVNEREYSSLYSNDNRTLTQTSPMGRSSEVTLDEFGRSVSMTAAGMPLTEWAYDGRGQVVSVKQTANGKTRSQSYAYSDGGWVEYFTDALPEKSKYSHDAVGEIDRITATG